MSSDQAQREMSLEEVIDNLRKGQPNHRAVREYDELPVVAAKRMLLLEEILDGNYTNRTGSEPEEIQQAVEKIVVLRDRLAGLEAIREKVEEYLVDEEGAAIELARLAGQPVPSRKKRSSYSLRQAVERIAEYRDGSIEARLREQVDGLSTRVAGLQKRYAFAEPLAKMMAELTNKFEPGELPLAKRAHAWGERLLNEALLKKTADWFNKSDPNKEEEYREKAKELRETIEAEREERQTLQKQYRGLEERLAHAAPLAGLLGEIVDRVRPGDERTLDRALAYRDELFASLGSDAGRIEAKTRRIVEAARSSAYDGCFSGDCEHSSQKDCDKAQGAIRDELTEAVWDLDRDEVAP